MYKAQSKDGTTIAYEGSGNGPALLLIHGGGSHPDRWKPIAARFEPSYTVYRMARRGVGESGDAPDHSPQRQGEDIAAVIEAIAKTRRGRVHVLAHSYFRESAELAQAALPHSRIVVLPGQQHIAMDTAPDLFAHEVAAFLEE